MRMNLSEGR